MYAACHISANYTGFKSHFHFQTHNYPQNKVSITNSENHLFQISIYNWRPYINTCLTHFGPLPLIKVCAGRRKKTVTPFIDTWSIDCTLKSKVTHLNSSSKTMQPHSSSSWSPFLLLRMGFNFFSPSLQNFNKYVWISPLMPFSMPSHSRQLWPVLSASFSSSAASELLHKFPFPP